MKHYACWYGSKNEGHEHSFVGSENVEVETSKRRALKFLWGKLGPQPIDDDIKDELERYAIAATEDRWVSWYICDCTNNGKAGGLHGVDEMGKAKEAISATFRRVQVGLPPLTKLTKPRKSRKVSHESGSQNET